MLQNVAWCAGASVSPMCQSCWHVCTTVRAAALPVGRVSGLLVPCGRDAEHPCHRLFTLLGNGFICKMKALQPSIPESFQTRTDYIILIPEELCASQLPSTIYRRTDGAHLSDCRSSASNFGADGSVSMMREIILLLCCVTALRGCPPTRQYGNLESGSVGLFSGMPVCVWD